MKIASSKGLLEVLKKREENLDKGKKITYAELDDKIKSMPIVNQFRDLYHRNRKNGMECEEAFVFAKNEIYENLIFYAFTINSDKDWMEFQKMKKGFDLINESPIFFTQWLEDTLKDKDIYQK